jgi:hypothetical protein
MYIPCGRLYNNIRIEATKATATTKKKERIKNVRKDHAHRFVCW